MAEEFEDDLEDEERLLQRPFQCVIAMKPLRQSLIDLIDLEFPDEKEEESNDEPVPKRSRNDERTTVRRPQTTPRKKIKTGRRVQFSETPQIKTFKKYTGEIKKISDNDSKFLEQKFETIKTPNKMQIAQWAWQRNVDRAEIIDWFKVAWTRENEVDSVWDSNEAIVIYEDIEFLENAFKINQYPDKCQIDKWAEILNIKEKAESKEDDGNEENEKSAVKDAAEIREIVINAITKWFQRKREQWEKEDREKNEKSLLSRDNIATLEAIYKAHPFPDSETLAMIATSMNVTQEKIKEWFEVRHRRKSYEFSILDGMFAPRLASTPHPTSHDLEKWTSEIDGILEEVEEWNRQRTENVQKPKTKNSKRKVKPCGQYVQYSDQNLDAYLRMKLKKKPDATIRDFRKWAEEINTVLADVLSWAKQWSITSQKQGNEKGQEMEQNFGNQNAPGNNYAIEEEGQEVLEQQEDVYQDYEPQDDDAIDYEWQGDEQQEESYQDFENQDGPAIDYEGVQLQQVPEPQEVYQEDQEGPANLYGEEQQDGIHQDFEDAPGIDYEGVHLQQVPEPQEIYQNFDDQEGPDYGEEEEQIVPQNVPNYTHWTTDDVVGWASQFLKADTVDLLKTHGINGAHLEILTIDDIFNFFRKKLGEGFERAEFNMIRERVTNIRNI